jgi:hypothetical protein
MTHDHIASTRFAEIAALLKRPEQRNNTATRRALFVHTRYLSLSILRNRSTVGSYARPIHVLDDPRAEVLRVFSCGGVAQALDRWLSRAVGGLNWAAMAAGTS